MSHLLLAILAAMSALVAGDCPLPYEPLDDTRCIFVDPFVTYTWQEAVDHCKVHAGTLLSFSDCETSALIYDYLRSQDATSNKNYWIGATDQAEEGVWKFTDGSLAPMGVPFWGPAEPNNGATYNCAFMQHNNNHYWYDFTCTSKLYSICLKDA
ncbi:C-type lectin domain family 17, member A-like isoform X2 [Penaeus monodon]|nr:C-type lectin domain family 17, member A-like isoform X2 [Penaeus monodon]XP_037804417.1 C-type lectin domain family 17, member A-like isoform X2 [Penaeus monodon]